MFKEQNVCGPYFHNTNTGVMQNALDIGEKHGINDLLLLVNNYVHEILTNDLNAAHKTAIKTKIRTTIALDNLELK